MQEVSNKHRNPKLGKGYMNAYRINPYNPLSYIFLTIALIVGIVAFGIIGIWKETDMTNPFKWD